MTDALSRSTPPMVSTWRVQAWAGGGRTPVGGYGKAVEVAKEAIRAGECFQIVPSQRFETPTTADPLDIYRVLRGTNPSPYMYLLRFDGFDIVGSSPEAHVKVTGRRALLHPIAGTRPRGATPEEDTALAAELVADPKERAEHVMLVDLGRNDLGRVCVPGSVRVPEFFHVERYSHVMHIVSTVVGELAEGRGALDALIATFPAGTLSGAPKVRAMEVIEELEPTRRGCYGGAVGYVDFAGDLDMAIAIRTALLPKAIDETYQYFASKFSFPTRVSPSGLRNILELLSQRTPTAKIDMNLGRYLDEGTLDELDREGFFKRLTTKN